MATVRLTGTAPAGIPRVQPMETAPDDWAEYLGTNPPQAHLRIGGVPARTAGARAAARWARFPRIALDARGLADDIALGDRKSVV